MRRKSQLDLDKKDRMLLYLLDLDGRMNYSKLSKVLRISKQVVKYRIERLEKEGFVKGYYAMIDTSRLGFTTFRIYIKFRNLTAEKKKSIIEYLKAQGNIWAVVLIAGRWDIALAISVEDIYGFYALWEKILERYLKHIKDYKICIYSPIYHYSKAYIIDKKDDSKVRILGGKGKGKFDEKDIRILVALSKNARLSLLELSKQVGISPELIKYRIRRLEERQIIQGYRAMIDVRKLGYEYYKAEMRLAAYDKMNQIMQFCHQHPNIYQIDKTIGGETLEIEFHVRSLNEMLSVIDELENLFPGVIESFDYITVLSEEKTTYMPEVIV